MTSPVKKKDAPAPATGNGKVDLGVIEPKLEKIVERKVEMHLAHYQGPMPPPMLLEQYDKIVPGCAKMIVDEFQANSKHSRHIEILGITGMIRKDVRAQWMAFVLVIIGFFLIWELATSGNERSAIAVATMLLGSIALAFLTGHVPFKKGDKQPEGSEDAAE